MSSHMRQLGISVKSRRPRKRAVVYGEKRTSKDLSAICAIDGTRRQENGKRSLNTPSSKTDQILNAEGSSDAFEPLPSHVYGSKQSALIRQQTSTSSPRSPTRKADRPALTQEYSAAQNPTSPALRRFIDKNSSTSCSTLVSWPLRSRKRQRMAVSPRRQLPFAAENTNSSLLFQCEQQTFDCCTAAVGTLESASCVSTAKARNSPPDKAEGTTLLVQGDVDDHNAFCAVCGGGSWNDQNLIVYCEGQCTSGLAVHQDCYGITEIPPNEKPWLCQLCELASGPQLCSLCGTSGGAMKISAKGKWAHVLCVLAFPETYFSDEARREGIEGVEAPSLQRRTMACSICDTRTGFVLQCAVKGCPKCFHPLCQLAVAGHMELSASSSHRARTFCPTHRPEKNCNPLESSLKTRVGHDYIDCWQDMWSDYFNKPNLKEVKQLYGRSQSADFRAEIPALGKHYQDVWAEEAVLFQLQSDLQRGLSPALPKYYIENLNRQTSQGNSHTAISKPGCRISLLAKVSLRTAEEKNEKLERELILASKNLDWNHMNVGGPCFAFRWDIEVFRGDIQTHFYQEQVPVTHIRPTYSEETETFDSNLGPFTVGPTNVIPVELNVIQEELDLAKPSENDEISAELWISSRKLCAWENVNTKRLEDLKHLAQEVELQFENETAGLALDAQLENQYKKMFCTCENCGKIGCHHNKQARNEAVAKETGTEVLKKRGCGSAETARTPSKKHVRKAMEILRLRQEVDRVARIERVRSAWSIRSDTGKLIRHMADARQLLLQGLLKKTTNL